MSSEVSPSSDSSFGNQSSSTLSDDEIRFLQRTIRRLLLLLADEIAEDLTKALLNPGQTQEPDSESGDGKKQGF
jgi:hypothetical protein